MSIHFPKVNQSLKQPHSRTAIGGVITQARSLRRVREDTRELRPDHGSSLADRVHDMDSKIDLVVKGQQVIADNADQVHELLSTRLRMHDIELRDIKKRLD